MSGRVSLVGAGPGDPALLTRAALRALRRADLVLYDALVPAPIVTLARRARRFPVGKRAGRHSLKQETIERLMIRAARRGSHVVRLKCGDPFVFGRGGEEALALRAAGVPFEVVPGVSAALAAPALAGIPVTHRGLAAGAVIVSGHAPEAWRPVLDHLPPGAATIVVLMGLATRRDIAASLLARGWDASTPSAVVFAAGHAESCRWLGALGELAAVEVAGPPDAAATVVIGAVSALAERIKPLPEAAAPRRLSAAGRQ